MNPGQMNRLAQGLTWGMGILLGVLAAKFFGVPEAAGELLWPSLALVGAFFFVQQRIIRESRLLLLQDETATLKRVVEMQRELDKTARRYKSLLEGAGNAIFVFNAETGGLQEVNRKGTELFGYSKEEMLSLTGKDLTPAPDRRRFSDLVRRVKRRGRGRAESLSFRRKDGEDFLGEVEARLIDLDDEKLVHVTLRDITFKQKAEREIKQRNRELSILNAIIGRANESLQLETVLAAILTETMEVFTAEAGVIHLQQHDGTGMTLATQSNLRDTLTCRLERLACSSDERYCCHSLAVPHPRTCPVVMHATADGWRTLAGVPLFAKQKVIGVLHILHAADRTYTPEEIRFFATIGHQIGIVIEHARIFAELTWKTDELLRSYSLLEKSSHQLALSQKRLKMNLALVERANKELERLDRMKNHFLGVISHEFRTPLTSIMGGTDFLLASRTPRSEEERRLLSIIHEGGARLNDIVSNLLKVARLEAKSLTLSKATLRLDELLETLHSHFLPLLGEREQELAFKDLEQIPSFAADREYLEEVFSQLLENAIKFSRDGGQILIAARLIDRIELADKQEILAQFNASFFDRMGTTRFIEVEIRDSGIGINTDEHLNIFDKFYGVGDIRHHSSGRGKFQGKGPGLGLTIVKGMVEAHGGMVWVESPCQDLDENPGSSFFVLLPTEEIEQQPAFPFMQGGNGTEQEGPALPQLVP